MAIHPGSPLNLLTQVSQVDKLTSLDKICLLIRPARLAQRRVTASRPAIPWSAESASRIRLVVVVVVVQTYWRAIGTGHPQSQGCCRVIVEVGLAKSAQLD